MAKGVNTQTGRGCRFKDRTGERLGRLVFTRTMGLNAHRQVIWEARCDCGEVTLTARPAQTRSCGCLQREVAAAVQRSKALPADERSRRERKNAERQRVRRRADPILAMQARLSRLHRHALAQVGALKVSPTFARLGYTPDQFALHIERQFSEGMDWLNMADWQIDHIVPVSEAKCEQDVYALNQLSNLRPMWARENNRKKNKRVTLL